MAEQGSQEPKHLYSTPAERKYWDESTATIAEGVVFDKTKTAADYGIENPKVFGVVETPSGG